MEVSVPQTSTNGGGLVPTGPSVNESGGLFGAQMPPSKVDFPVKAAVAGAAVGATGLYAMTEQEAADTTGKLNRGEAVSPDEAAAAADFVIEDSVGKGNSGRVDIAKPDGLETSIWETFNDNFDLTTVGLTLMATNGNGQNLAANLGLALQAGKASSATAKAREVSRKDKDFSKKLQEERVAILREDLDIKRVSEERKMQAALAVREGITLSAPTKAEISEISDSLNLYYGSKGLLDVEDNQSARAKARQVAQNLQLEEGRANQLGRVLTPEQRQSIIVNSFGDFTERSFRSDKIELNADTKASRDRVLFDRLKELEGR
jgi:hypothetical protein